MESIWNVLEQSIFDKESSTLNNCWTLKCWACHGTITIDVFSCSNDQPPILTNTIQIVKKYNNYNKSSKVKKRFWKFSVTKSEKEK